MTGFCVGYCDSKIAMGNNEWLLSNHMVLMFVSVCLLHNTSQCKLKLSNQQYGRSVYRFYWITHPHPVPASSVVRPMDTPGDDDPRLPTSLPLLVVVGVTALGLTDTLTGVGCVLNTGTWQSSSVLVSGMSIPFPMQISRNWSPPEQSGRSTNK